jgi:anthranilate synthase/aminodeoxychorismate synthase-like glutamine amidotransferase
MILFIDNYDSFVYNLVQYIGEIEPELSVFRNDEITVEQATDLSPDRIVISPGPGHPKEAGVSVKMVRHFTGKVPILGVCLGHQSIAQAFGATVDVADRLLHGKTSNIYHKERGILRGLPNPFVATRYHSLVVAEETLPEELVSVAYTSDGELMGLQHRDYPVFGLQFHPESILTVEGKMMIENFLNTD